MDEDRGEIYQQKRTFLARYESLAKIRAFVKKAARIATLNPPDTYAVQLAVDEACSNIIEHAYGGPDRGKLECTCTVTQDELVITLKDFGTPFDPRGVRDPDLHAKLEKRKKGGLGLFFIRHLMDDIHFEFEVAVGENDEGEKGNILTLVKRREAST